MRPAPRRLTVLASLDVAGYTPLVERDERGTLAELAAIRRHILRPTVSAHVGNLFKTMGDGALIEFSERRGFGPLGNGLPDSYGGKERRARRKRHPGASGYRPRQRLRPGQ